MENYIVINGKKVELTKEQLEKLGIGITVGPFERRKDGLFYAIVTDGNVLCDVDNCSPFVNGLCDVANYCRDENLMKQRALHETLSRLLWRFSMQNGWGDIDWNDIERKYYIFFDNLNNKFDVDFNDDHKSFNTYFISLDTAERAIDEIIKPFMKEHPDFVW